MKRFIALVLCLCLITLPGTWAAAIADFNTIQKTVITLGIMTGDEKGNMNLTSPVTRAEFAKMMTAASVYKDTVGDGSGYSPFKDVKSSQWFSGYVKAAVDAKWMIGYSDGTFRPNSTIRFEEAASAILKMLDYSASDLSGTYPNAQMSKFRALKLDTGIAPAEGRALTRQECMYIFYNLMGTATKSGAIYGATLGHAINSAGEIDYDELVKANIEGPFVMQSSDLSAVIPFNVNTAVVYRNNTLSAASAVGLYDVVYYSASTRTVWVYSNRAVGMYTLVSPNAVSPSTVTVAGNTYTLETSAAKNKVSATGQFAIGDTLALLLGMDGTVVDIISASEVDGAFYGMVTSLELATYAIDASSSTTSYVLTAACTDGITRECVVDGEFYTVGSVVKISYAKGETTVTGAGASNLSGKFSSNGKKFDNLKLADDVQIMDISKEGSWKLLYPSRLSGVTLQSGDVRYHVLNEKQEISRLILNNVTGDLHKYGIITSIRESQIQTGGDSLSQVSSSYGYVIDGKPGTYSYQGILSGIRSGPAVFVYKDGQINSMKNLEGVSLSDLTSLTAMGGNKRYAVSDTVSVYLRSGSSYGLTELTAVNNGAYRLTGYYESTYPAGGQIRIVIAEKI